MNRIHKKRLTAKDGFTLIELMIVVAIIGILAAIAIPQYLNYLKGAKINTCAANFAIASSYVSYELKLAPQDRSHNIVDELNRGGKHDPFNSSLPAFIQGPSTVSNNNCQISITISGRIDTDFSTVTDTDTVTVKGVKGGNAFAASEVVYIASSK